MRLVDAITSFFKSPPPSERKRGEKMKPRKWRGEPSRHLPKEVMEVVSAYEPKPKEHPLALRYQPKLKGRGGEHLVFGVAGSPDVVVKVEKTAILEGLSWLADGSGQLEQRLQERVKEQRRLFSALKKIFGAEHVLPQKKAVMPIPLTEGLVQELHVMAGKKKVTIPAGTRELPTIVTVQREAKVLEGVRYFGLSTGAADQRLLDQVGKDPGVRYQYRKATEPLMNAETAKRSTIGARAMSDLLESGDMDRLMRKAQEDVGLRAALKDFCERAATFAQETGEIIDLVGKDNVVFYQKPDGVWTYLLIDPFYSFQPRALDMGREAYLKAQVDVPMNSKTVNAFVQGVNFTRIVNGIGKLVGSEKWYDYLPSDGGQPPDVLGAIWPALKRTAKKTAGEAA